MKRTLMIFLCTSAECCTSDHAFTTLRCQVLEPAAPQHSSESEDVPQNLWASVSWKPVDHERGSTPTAVKNTALDLSELMDDLNELGRAIDTNESMKRSCVPERVPCSDAEPVRKQGAEVIELGPVLPEFWIEARTEAAAQLARAHDAEHIERLLAEYEASVGDTNELVDERRPLAGGGEAYEETDAHTKFHERLALQPTQCARCEAECFLLQ
jgi:hypothetical protein